MGIAPGPEPQKQKANTSPRQLRDLGPNVHAERPDPERRQLDTRRMTRTLSRADERQRDLLKELAMLPFLKSPRINTPPCSGSGSAHEFTPPLGGAGSPSVPGGRRSQAGKAVSLHGVCPTLLREGGSRGGGGVLTGVLQLFAEGR